MKLAIVTGAQGTLGTFFVKFFSERGYRCLGLSRSQKRTLLKNETFFQIGDISDPETHKLIQDSIMKNIGSIKNKLTDLWLINNAAIQGEVGISSHLDRNSYEKCMNANFYFPLCLQNVITKHYISNFNINILNVVGGGANDTFPFFSPYAISKVALARLSEQIAVEWKASGIRNMRIACCTPGFMSTGFHNQSIKGRENIPTIEGLKKQITANTLADVPFKKFRNTLATYIDNEIDIEGGLFHLKNDADELNMYSYTENKELFKLRRVDNFNVFSGKSK